MSPLPICLMGLVAQIGLSQPAVAQSNAPASQPLLMDREKEIALVLSACPPALASKAAVYVLDERAMSRSATARTVSRQSFSTRLRPLRSRNAWTSKARAHCSRAYRRWPSCALRERTLKRSNASWPTLSPRGLPPAGPAGGRLQSTENVVPLDPEKGIVGHFPPHVLFYAPYLTNADLGSQNLAWPAFVAGSGTPNALIIVPVPEEAQAGPGYEHR